MAYWKAKNEGTSLPGIKQFKSTKKKDGRAGSSAFQQNNPDDGSKLLIDGQEVTQNEWNIYNKQGERPDYVSNPDLHKEQKWGRLPSRLLAS